MTCLSCEHFLPSRPVSWVGASFTAEHAAEFLATAPHVGFVGGLCALHPDTTGTTSSRICGQYRCALSPSRISTLMYIDIERRIKARDATIEKAIKDKARAAKEAWAIDTNKKVWTMVPDKPAPRKKPVHRKPARAAARRKGKAR